MVIALPLAYMLNAWADEASSLYSSQHGLMFALQNAGSDEKQAPLYFWLLSIWRYADRSIFFARLLSIVFSLGSIAIFIKLASSWFSRRGLIFAVFAFGLHPYLIWASLEIRVYAMIVFLSLALIMAFFNVFLSEEKPNFLRHAIFFILSVISLYTNYYLGFLLVGLFSILIYRRDQRAAFRYVAIMAAAGLCFVPQILQVKSQFAENTSGFIEPRSIFEALQIVWNIFLTFALPTELFPEEPITVVSLVRLWMMRAAVVFGIGYLIWKRPKLSPETRSMLVVVAVTFAGLVAAYFLLGRIYLNIRHAAVIFAPLLLAIFLLFRDGIDLNEMRLKPATAIAALLIAISYFYSVVTLYPTMAKRGDWHRVAAYISANEKQGEPIVVFPPFEALALPYHYNGANRVLPPSGFFDQEASGAMGSAASMTRQNQAIIDTIPKDAERVWLVVGGQCISTDACRPLENFVNEHYTIESVADLYHERVMLLRKIQK